MQILTIIFKYYYSIQYGSVLTKYQTLYYSYDKDGILRYQANNNVAANWRTDNWVLETNRKICRFGESGFSYTNASLPINYLYTYTVKTLTRHYLESLSL